MAVHDNRMMFEKCLVISGNICDGCTNRMMGRTMDGNFGASKLRQNQQSYEDPHGEPQASLS